MGPNRRKKDMYAGERSSTIYVDASGNAHIGPILLLDYASTVSKQEKVSPVEPRCEQDGVAEELKI